MKSTTASARSACDAFFLGAVLGAWAIALAANIRVAKSSHQRLWFIVEISSRRSRMLEVNAKAPDFSLPDENGNTVRLADFRGKDVVLFFYPKANTPG